MKETSESLLAPSALRGYSEKAMVSEETNPQETLNLLMP